MDNFTKILACVTLILTLAFMASPIAFAKNLDESKKYTEYCSILANLAKGAMVLRQDGQSMQKAIEAGHKILENSDLMREKYESFLPAVYDYPVKNTEEEREALIQHTKELAFESCWESLQN